MADLRVSDCHFFRAITLPENSRCFCGFREWRENKHTYQSLVTFDPGTVKALHTAEAWVRVAVGVVPGRADIQGLAIGYERADLLFSSELIGNKFHLSSSGSRFLMD